MQIAWNTLDRWLERTAAARRRFNHRMLTKVRIRELQADEIRAAVAGHEQRVSAAIEVWSRLWLATGNARTFLRAVSLLKKPVVIDWGFPTSFLYVVSALQAEGVQTWWLCGERSQARAAFVARGGIAPECFDSQMNAIERDCQRIAFVFGKHVLAGLHSDGTQRLPEDLWSEINRAS